MEEYSASVRLRLLWALLPGVAAAQFSLDLQVGAVAVERSSTPALYATLNPNSSSSAVLRSTDGGAIWKPVYLNPAEAGAPQPKLQALVADPDISSTLYAAVSLKQGGVLKSVNQGTTWTRPSAGLPGGDGNVELLIAVPAGALTPQALYAKTGNSVYKSVNRGDSWVLQSTLPAAGWFTVNLMNPAVMFLAGYRGAIYRSTDEGVTWNAVSVIQLYPDSGNSTDSVTQIVSDPSNPSVLYATVRGGLLSVNGISIIGLYQSKDQGATWTNIVPDTEVYRIWVEPTGQGTLFYTVPEGNRLCRSSGGGSGWTCSSGADGTGPGSAMLTFDPNHAGVIYAASNGIYKSADYGQTWRRLAGTVQPTLAKPADPLQFSLVAGARGSRQFSVQALENSKWAIPFTAKSSDNWLTLSAAGGTTPATLTLSANTTGLAAGSYKSAIQISAPQAANSPVSVPVYLTISQPAYGSAYKLTVAPGAGLADASPAGLALDSAGNLYIADSGGHRVRKVSPAGEAATIAGTGEFGDTGDNGPATAAKLWRPEGVVLSGGNLYIADSYNDRVRKVDSSGVITAFGGRIFFPRGMTVDSTGTILVVSGSEAAIYTISPAGAVTKRVSQGLRDPRDVVVDKAGLLYVADSGNNRIQRIAADGTAITVAGTGAEGFAGDGGPAAKALLSNPASLALDSSGNLFIADSGNSLIRVVTPDGVIRTLSLSGGQLSSPTDILAGANGTLWVADSGNKRVVKLTPQALSILNAASYDTGIAPGSLVAIFGSNLASGSQTATVSPWPTTLAGATVTINGVPAPIYYASPAQVNAQVPFEIPAGAAQVTAGGASDSFTVSAAAPGLFQSEAGRAVAQNEDYSVNSPASPARPGSYIVAYLTGQGLVDNPAPTGAPAPADPLSRPVLQDIAATLNGRPCDVAFLGLTPGLTGVAQINLKVPDDLPAGDYSLVVSIGAARSKPALIAVR